MSLFLPRANEFHKSGEDDDYDFGSSAYPVAQLSDDFNAAQVNTAKWTKSLAGVTQSGGVLDIQTIGSGLLNLTSVAGYTMRDSSVFVEIAGAYQGGSGFTHFVWGTGSNFFEIQVGGTALFFIESVAGVSSNTQITYDTAVHRWWRIRHNSVAGLVYWETSPDGTTWTVQRSKAPGISVVGPQNVQISIQDTVDFGTFLGGQFDNLNVAPQAGVPVPSLVSETRTRISRIVGFDSTDVVWSSNQSFTAYQFRVVALATDPVTSGVLVEQNQNPAAGGAAGTQYTSTITDAELEAVSPAEGAKIVKLFVQNATGWSA